MNDPQRLDLSPLDPARDPARWSAFVDATLARVDAALAERAHAPDPLSLLASWRRPVLIAAGVALALLVPVELLLEIREARAERVARLVTLSAGWERGAPPTGDDFMRALAEGSRP